MQLIILIVLVTSITVFLISNRNRFFLSQRDNQRITPVRDENINKMIWQDRSVSSSIPSTIYDQIQWVDYPTEPLDIDNNLNIEERQNQHNSKFFDTNQDLPIEEKLKFLIGSADYSTLEIFAGGEKVYFCLSCNVAYHEDTWQEIDKKCQSCNSYQNTKLYILPRNI